MNSSDKSAERSRSQILSDAYLNSQYKYLFEEIISSCDSGQFSTQKIVEIGAAGGITKELFPWIYTVDVRSCSGIDLIADAKQFSKIMESFDILLAKDTLHHLSDIELFFKELEQVMPLGALAIFLEPNWNLWSRFIYKYLHPEKWDSRVQTLAFRPLDPMDSNQAIPYLFFVRHADKFRKNFPNLQVEILKPVNGISYLLSGGVNKRTFIPSSFLIWLSKLERKSRVINRFFGLNRIIKVTRI